MPGHIFVMITVDANMVPVFQPMDARNQSHVEEDDFDHNGWVGGSSVGVDN